MKNKIKKPLIAVIIVIAALVLIIFAGLFIMGERGFYPTVGTYIKAASGDNMILMDGGPCIMSNQTGNENVFSGLQTGDKILIINCAVNTSYPGYTGCYFCLRLGKGDISDIPEKHLEQLKELGWISQ